MTVAVILARQRSGTGVLGSILDKHPRMSYFGEVFHNEELDKSWSYFAWLLARVNGEPERALPMAAQRNFDDFVDHLEGLSQKRVKVIDVKYNSTHYVNGVWRSLVRPPGFLELAIEREMPIVHILRRNLLKTFVSGRLAELNRVWHAQSEEQIRHRTLRVDRDPMMNYLESTTREIELMQGYLSRHASVVHFDYEEMLSDDGGVSQDVEDRLCKLLQVEPFTERLPTWIKQTGDDLADVIENYEEVWRWLEPTPYAWMAKS